MLPHPVDKRGSGQRSHVFVCAWCRNRMGPGRPPNEAIENWGICRHCLGRRLAALPAEAESCAGDAPPAGPGGADARVTPLRVV